MKKFFKLGKRMLALFIVVLLNINSYAAVGANDGSAFVTKAEFDALVNTFNEQMDTYQSGLNSKIDGAIANYLAGLSSTQRADVEPLNKGAIWSVSTVSDKHDWVEGNLKLSFTSFLSRGATSASSGDNTGGFILEGSQAGASQEYWEHIIGNTNVYAGYAEYLGYYKSDLNAVLYGGDMQKLNSWRYSDSCSWLALQFNSGKSPAMNFATGTSKNANSINQGLFSRTMNESAFADVICTPADGLEYPYFNPSNLSVPYETFWCKDVNMNDNDLHGYMQNASDAISVTSCKAYGITYGSNTNSNLTISMENESNRRGWGDNCNKPTYNSGTVIGCRPFVGFSSDITNWRDLYVKTYDEIIDELELKSKAHVATDAAGKKHLLVTNGLPIIKANKDDVIHMPLKFDKIGDEYANIDIWLKASAFKLDENVKTTNDADMIKAENEDKMIPSAYSNAITLDAINGKGSGILKFRMPKDGYVFMKWSVAGNEAAGGGVFRPQTMSVELAE